MFESLNIKEIYSPKSKKSKEIRRIIRKTFFLSTIIIFGITIILLTRLPVAEGTLTENIVFAGAIWLLISLPLTITNAWGKAVTYSGPSKKVFLMPLLAIILTFILTFIGVIIVGSIMIPAGHSEAAGWLSLGALIYGSLLAGLNAIVSLISSIIFYRGGLKLRDFIIIAVVFFLLIYGFWVTLGPRFVFVTPLHSLARITRSTFFCDLIEINFPAEKDERDICYREVAPLKKEGAICEEIREEFQKNYCYLKVAKAVNDPSICNKITEEDDRLRKDCKERAIEEAAKEANDPSICNKIKRDWVRENCKEEVER